MLDFTYLKCDANAGREEGLVEVRVHYVAYAQRKADLVELYGLAVGGGEVDY